MKSPFGRRTILLSVLLVGYALLPAGAREKTAVSSAAVPSADQTSQQALPESSTSVTIPGPLRSFLRMAAISQKVSPEEVLPLLAYNIGVDGYHGQGKGRKPTEYLVLLKRYVQQARELLTMAGPQGVIRLSSCSEAQPLLTALGYRLREACGPTTSVETADPESAFLTIDSGFPLTDLEETLRGGKPFVHPFPASQVPLLFSRSDWALSEKGKRDQDLIDSLLHDPSLARLYWALSRMDANTRNSLRQSPGLPKLLPMAAVLDFYGSHMHIRSGRVVIPGGAPADAAWKGLVGAGPDAPADFILRLLAKDGGWLAAYFDALSRVGGSQQAYFTEPARLKRFYEALRGQDINPSPARPVFRPNPGLLLLVSRLQFEPDGQPHVPGNLEVWSEILHRKSDSKLVREWAKRAGHWNNSEHLVEGMFGLSRVGSDDGPLQVYLTISELDRGRPAGQRLKPDTVRMLAEKFSRFSNQYLVFSEFHGLNDTSITRFLEVAGTLDRISDHMLRADALGIFQANVGLWQILARQGQIPNTRWNDSWQRVVNAFANAGGPAQVFDAGQNSVTELFRATTGKPRLSQDEIIDLLAGPNQTNSDGERVKQEMATRIRSVFDAQRLVSLDTVLALGDGLSRLAQGKAASDGLIRLAGELREFEMPKPLFSSRERTEWTFGLYNNRHTQSEMSTDLTKVIKSPGSPNELAAARGHLVPFLRDSLVGLNYAYYEPPGAQMVFNNPLFVRSHDFSGEMTMGGEESWKTPGLFGRGWTASGGAHLAGSLADLPYVLAHVEQHFIVPENVQSLIWEDLVPCLVTSSVLPRWWRVSRSELHAVALYQQLGEQLLAAAAADNDALRERVVNVLSSRLLPQRLEQVEDSLRSGHREEALSHLAPAEIFYLGTEFYRSSPGDVNKWHAGQELEKLARAQPEAVSWERLSEDFGVPHPSLAQTYTRELLNVKPFPTFLGYSSRLLAESWDSNNLYWARLADEMGYPPVMLNRLIPQLTHRMVEKIFATHLEDWPALLRALRETGEEFRLGKITAPQKTSAATRF